MRLFVVAFLLLLFTSSAIVAASPAAPAKPSPVTMTGTVSDPSGAIIPNAQIQLLSEQGVLVGTFHSTDNGTFKVTAPHSGNYTLQVSEPGFDATSQSVSIGTTKGTPLHIILKIAAVATSVEVNAETSTALTSTEENRDSSVMTSNDLKDLPIFDNDYSTAMSAFLDDSAIGSGGSGLLVDGVESNRATVSASAVQEVRINQDPYSAQYYWPGRGQMEIISKSAKDNYHGQFNFLFRDSALNAQNALAPSKPYEQRRVYEGHVTGPAYHLPKSGFLISFNRAEEDMDQVVSATVLPTPSNPDGIFAANVPAPTRNTEFSERLSYQFSEKHSAYVEHSYQDWKGKNQGVGGQTLAEAAYNSHSHENDITLHLDSLFSPTLFNQISILAEIDSSHQSNANEVPRISVSGYFTGGSAQADSHGTEYNFNLFQKASWTHGHHTILFGLGIPHIARRAYIDNTNALGTYIFSPTIAADGVTVLASSLNNYVNHLPSSYTQNTGDTRFIYHQENGGVFLQDQWNINGRFSLTPGIRYDWQKFLPDNRLTFSPRVSFAWVLDPASKMVVRGGGGIYYDRIGGGPILDLERYEHARRRSILLSLNPATLPSTGCVPITLCTVLADQPPNLVQKMPNSRTPYSMQYGLSIERQVGEKATAVLSGYSMRSIGEFLSIDINAPTPASGYTLRPNPAYGRIRQMQPTGFAAGSGMDFQFRGRANKYFTGFGRYTWSHYGSNNNGINWFPENQYAPQKDWSNANFDRRHRVGMYATFNPDSVLNLSAGIWANTGTPWTILTGADPYGDGLYNARPNGVGRYSQRMPAYTNLDLRWGHDFSLTGSKETESPHLGLSVGAFNVLNHPNTSSLNTVETSSTFMQPTSVSSPRRIQIGARFEF